MAGGYTLPSASTMKLTASTPTVRCSAARPCASAAPHWTAAMASCRPLRSGAARATTANQTATATLLCCITGAAAAAGSVAVNVHTPTQGNAVHVNGPYSFTYMLKMRVPPLYLVAGAGSTVTISMDTPAADPTVTIGGRACAVTSVNAKAGGLSDVLCTVPNAPPGTVPVAIFSKGLTQLPTDPPLTFTHVVTVTGVQPATGSAGGGTLLTLSGTGFKYLSDAASGGAPALDPVRWVARGARLCHARRPDHVHRACLAASSADIGLDQRLHPNPPAHPSPVPPPPLRPSAATCVATPPPRPRHLRRGLRILLSDRRPRHRRPFCRPIASAALPTPAVRVQWHVTNLQRQLPQLLRLLWCQALLPCLGYCWVDSRCCEAAHIRHRRRSRRLHAPCSPVQHSVSARTRQRAGLLRAERHVPEPRSPPLRRQRRRLGGRRTLRDGVQ